MHVQLDFKSAVMNETFVELFIAAPGLSTPATLLQPLNPAGNRITFPLPPSDPNEKSLEWSPLSMAALFPTHCCVLAIADHPDEDCNLPCDPVPPVTFGQVFPNVLLSNKIAQKNINFQACPPTNPSPLWSALPWLQFANPMEEPVNAMLEIEAIGTLKLRHLFIDVDGEKMQEIDPNGEKVTLQKHLGIGDRRIFRLRAELPSGARIGSQLSLDVRFYDGDELLIGYQHVIMIMPGYKALIQVADRLVGALLAVAKGCESESAKRIAEKLIKWTADFQEPAEKDYLDSTLLAKAVTIDETVFQEKNSWESFEFNQYLSQLSSLLHRPNEPSPAQWLEKVRELADRIHEPASRLARQKAGIEQINS
jgi:hypothetical protein